VQSRFFIHLKTLSLAYNCLFKHLIMLLYCFFLDISIHKLVRFIVDLKQDKFHYINSTWWRFKQTMLQYVLDCANLMCYSCYTAVDLYHTLLKGTLYIYYYYIIFLIYLTYILNLGIPCHFFFLSKSLLKAYFTLCITCLKLNLHTCIYC
jgi:hypothetical protein